MELEEAIKILKKDLELTKIANECGLATKGEFKKEIEAIETVLNHLTKEDKMIENAKNRIEYYLMGNSTLNDFNVREKELEILLKILNKAEESE